MSDALRTRIADALKAHGLRKPDAVSTVAAELDAESLMVLASVAITGIQRTLLRQLPPDPRQGWLALPEYQHVPAEVATESLEQLRARIRTIERRIVSYDYARRSPEKLKADKAELRELKRIDARTAALLAGTPALDVNGAMAIYQVAQEKPAIRQRREAGKASGRARQRSTKNQ